MGANLKRFVGTPESNYRERERLTAKDFKLLEYNSYQIAGKKIGTNLYKRNLAIICEQLNK